MYGSIPTTNKVLKGYIGITLSVHISCKCNSSQIDEPILMKVYTVVLYGLRMYMKEDNPGPNNIKGDNYCHDGGYPLWFNSQFYFIK